MTHETGGSGLTVDAAGAPPGSRSRPGRRLPTLSEDMAGQAADPRSKGYFSRVGRRFVGNRRFERPQPGGLTHGLLREILYLSRISWRRGWDSNPRWLLTTPLFESDRSRDAKWREVSLRAALNTDSGTLVIRRPVAGCAKSPSSGPKWRPYQPRLAVTGRGKGLGLQERGGGPRAVHSQRRTDLCVDGRPDFKWRR